MWRGRPARCRGGVSPPPELAGETPAPQVEGNTGTILLHGVLPPAKMALPGAVIRAAPFSGRTNSDGRD